MNPIGLLRLVRPANCLMMGFAVVVGAAIAEGAAVIDSWPLLVLGFATGSTLGGGAMAVNDYYDREIDALNEPSRPIPSGSISPTEALLVWIFLSALGLASAWMTSTSCLALAILAWALMMLYSTRGKRTGLLGNLIVSTCIAIPFVYGGLAVENAVPTTSLLFALLAFLSNTGREITKGVVDVEGDASKGVRTVAVSWGAKAAALLASALYLSAIPISFVPLYLGAVSALYAPPVLLTDLGLVHASYSLVRNPGRENGRRVKNHVLLWMMSGLVGFLLGSLFRTPLSL